VALYRLWPQLGYNQRTTMEKNPVLNYARETGAARSPLGSYVFASLEMVLAVLVLAGATDQHDLLLVGIFFGCAAFSFGHGLVLLMHRKIPRPVIRLATAAALVLQLAAAVSGLAIVSWASTIEQRDRLGGGLLRIQGLFVFVVAIALVTVCLVGSACCRVKAAQ
jgi:hypothetical protein